MDTSTNTITSLFSIAMLIIQHHLACYGLIIGPKYHIQQDRYVSSLGMQIYTYVCATYVETCVPIAMLGVFLECTKLARTP